MPKHVTPLTVAEVRTADPGTHTDGLGLMLDVQKTGAAQWILRYRFAGKRRDMGLGPARGRDAVSLAHARLIAADKRALIRAGVDPVEQRKTVKAERVAEVAAEAKTEVTTFSVAVEKFLEDREAGWKNAKHRAQWRMTLTEYAGKKLGKKPIADITTDDVLGVLRPIWFTIPETASRLRARIEALLDYARVKGWRTGENPARWRGHLKATLPSPTQVRPVKHHAALPWPELPAFMADLRTREAAAARALEFAILTAARSGEVLGARWNEINLKSAVWTVPAERMKAKREHRVPLVPVAIALLRAMLPAADDKDSYVFPGQAAQRPLSIMALAMLLRRMKHGDVTAHGFRSCFRDWAGETTPHPREVVEQALAHRTGNAVEQAYARGDLFTKRRKLMQDWTQFCEDDQAAVSEDRPSTVEGEP
jgi:integrase